MALGGNARIFLSNLGILVPALLHSDFLGIHAKNSAAPQTWPHKLKSNPFAEKSRVTNRESKTPESTSALELAPHPRADHSRECSGRQSPSFPRKRRK